MLLGRATLADLTGGDVTIADLRMLTLAQMIWDKAELEQRRGSQRAFTPPPKRARR